MTWRDPPKPTVYMTTLWLTPGAVHSRSLDKCIMTCIHHYSITQNIFATLQIPCTLFIPLSPAPGNNHWYMYCCHSSTSCRMPYSWRLTVSTLFTFVSFPPWYALKIPPCLFMAWQLISSSFFFFFLLRTLYAQLGGRGDSNSQPQDQESQAPLTEPAQMSSLLLSAEYSTV